MVKTGDTGEVLVAGDGVWFHPDDPAEDPGVDYREGR